VPNNDNVDICYVGLVLSIYFAKIDINKNEKIAN